MNWIDEIEKRANEANPGPCVEYSLSGPYDNPQVALSEPSSWPYVEGGVMYKTDSLIANDIPKLIEALRIAMEALETLEGSKEALTKIAEIGRRNNGG